MAPIKVSGLRKLDGQDRFYEHGTERFPSVTTIIKHMVPKPGLVRWQARLVAKSAIDSLEELRKLDPAVAESTLLALADASKDTKAGLGTEVHRYAEATALGKTPKTPTEAAIPYVEQYEAFVKQVQPEYIDVELPVFNRTYGYAGTADIYAKINGKKAVIDIKTGKSIWSEVSLQLAAYARSEFSVRKGVEQPAPVVKLGYVLHISETGWELRKIDIGDTTFAAFINALDMYRWLTKDSQFVIGGLVDSGQAVLQ